MLSASKIDSYYIDLLTLMKGISLSSEIFKNNKVKNVVLLTATPPTSVDKLWNITRVRHTFAYHLT
jgi:hypothetical protein